MSKRKPGRLIKRTDIKEELRPIKQSNVDYITPSGNVYCNYEDDLFFKKTNSVNHHNGYLYTSIRCKDGKQRGCRTHRLVAEAYLPNEDNLPVVMHLDNDKSNPAVENLKWGTISENTKAAFDDGLEVNAKGMNDSQSIPVVAFTKDGDRVGLYGSATEASKILGVSKSTVFRHCNKEIPGKPRRGYIFRFLDEFLKDDFIL